MILCVGADICARVCVCVCVCVCVVTGLHLIIQGIVGVHLGFVNRVEILPIRVIR